jgi:hypothetical protein
MKRAADKADVTSRFDLVCCNPTSVAMRVVAGLASAKLAPLPSGGTTGWTSDSEHLFWAEFAFHIRGTVPQNGAGRRHASGQYLRSGVTTMIPDIDWALAEVGDRLPQYVFDNSDRD